MPCERAGFHQEGQDERGPGSRPLAIALLRRLLRAPLLAPIRLAPALLSLGCAVLGGGDRAAEPSAAFHVLYPPPPDQPRIQHLATFTTEEDLKGKPSRFRRFIVGDPEYAELGKPYGVALHDHKLFVCDTKINAVLVFDFETRSLAFLGDRPPGRLSKPINIAVDEDGTRYVADTRLGRVMVYDGQNQYVNALGDPDDWTPSDVAVQGKRLYVTDVKNGRAVILDKESGKEIRSIGRKGSGEGELFFPTNIDVDGDGNVYVSDTGNFRVLKFDSRGRHLRQFGELGRQPGRFVRPKGIAVDRASRLYVVDTAFENVQIFDPDGTLLLFFGTAGNVPGGLNVPAQVEIDYENVDLFADRVVPGHSVEFLILVTSQFGLNKVNVYGFLGPGEKRKTGRGSRSAAASD